VGVKWHDRVMWQEACHLRVARAEAERLILGQEISPPVTPDSQAEAYRKRRAVATLLRDGYALALERKWKESAQAYATALQHPGLHWQADSEASEWKCLQGQMGTAFVRAGDRASHERLCRFLLTVLPAEPPVSEAERYSRLCFLDGKSLPADLQRRGLELGRFAVTNRFREGTPVWICQAGGMAEFYAGDPERAVELLMEAEKAPLITCRGAAMVYRAMALKKLGRDAQAAGLLRQAEALLAEPLPGRSGLSWWDVELCQIALEQARPLIETPSKP